MAEKETKAMTTMLKVDLKQGVLFDQIGKVLNHVYDEKKYDDNYNRKPEYYGVNKPTN